METTLKHLKKIHNDNNNKNMIILITVIITVVVIRNILITVWIAR